MANHETDYVTLLFGIAGGGFERRDHSRFRVDVSPHPHAVRLHDIDYDGHADLLVDDRSPESIRLFRGLGDGTSSGATSTIDVGGDPYRGMSLADVTGDGLADLITPNPDHVAILAAEEDGGFRARATLPAPFGPFSVLAADLNAAKSTLRRSGHPQPLDELLARGAFEQGVSQLVDAFGAGELPEKPQHLSGRLSPNFLSICRRRTKA